MALDFTTRAYKKLLEALIKQGYSFTTVTEVFSASESKEIILRHDVDALPENSLFFARLQASLGITGTYYFRISPGSLNEDFIVSIYSLGHEIGYHYEDFDLAYRRLRAGYPARKTKSITEKELAEYAIVHFEKNLESFRKIVPIKSICMHGSPWSRWDNRLLWKYYDYREFGIENEPYFDIDFTERLYITDTGRRWDGSNVSFRDKACFSSIYGHKSNGETDKEFYHGWRVIPKSGSLINMKPEGVLFNRNFNYKSSCEIIRDITNSKFPSKAMMTFHPQRWSDNIFPWVKEFIFQGVKNAVKYMIVRTKFA